MKIKCELSKIILTGTWLFGLQSAYAAEVDIYAGSATTYGANNVATMISETQTFGLATFQLSIDVDPMAGGGVRSLGNTAWGIDSGESGGSRFTFDGGVGTSGQFVEGINNIQIINFNANGGGATSSDIANLSFISITILDAHNGGDLVKVVAGGVSKEIKLKNASEAIDLQALAGTTAVSNFSIGNANNNAGNRLSVSHITVSYSSKGVPEPSILALLSFGFGK